MSECIPLAIQKKVASAVRALETVVDHARELGGDTVEIRCSNGFKIDASAPKGFKVTTEHSVPDIMCQFFNSDDVDDGGFDFVPEEG